MDCYDEAIEYVKKDVRFAAAIRIAGGPEALTKAAEEVRSGRYISPRRSSRASEDFDGGFAAAFDFLCNGVALVAAIFAIRREFKDDAELRMSAKRLLHETSKRAGNSWRRVAPVLHVPSLVISVASTVFKLTLSDPPSLAAMQGGGPDILASAPATTATSGAGRKFRQLLRALPLQAVSFLGTSFAATWAIAAYVAGHAVSLGQSFVSIYVWSACVFSACRAVVLAREIQAAHRRIRHGVWRRAGNQPTRVDMSEHSILQAVLDFVARVSPQNKKHIRMIVRTDDVPDRAQAIATLSTAHDYLLIPAADDKRLNPEPLFQANQYWVVAHELGHLIDPVERARKGAVWMAALTALFSAALLAPLAISAADAAVLIAIAVSLCLLRWTLQVVLREAQADYLAIQVMMCAHHSPPDRARTYLDYVRSRFSLELHSGPLLHRLKIWGRWWLLIPSWTSLIEGHESPVRRLEQWNNAILSGSAIMITATGGYKFGMPSGFISYSWYVAFAMISIAFVTIVVLTIIQMKFDRSVEALPSI